MKIGIFMVKDKINIVITKDNSNDLLCIGVDVVIEEAVNRTKSNSKNPYN